VARVLLTDSGGRIEFASEKEAAPFRRQFERMFGPPVVRGKQRHQHVCPNCRRRIRWMLLYCSICSWNGKPLKNIGWLRGRP
jgi:hypothetical protein